MSGSYFPHFCVQWFFHVIRVQSRINTCSFSLHSLHEAQTSSILHNYNQEEYLQNAQLRLFYKEDAFQLSTHSLIFFHSLFLFCPFLCYEVCIPRSDYECVLHFCAVTSAWHDKQNDFSHGLSSTNLHVIFSTKGLWWRFSELHSLKSHLISMRKSTFWLFLISETSGKMWSNRLKKLCNLFAYFAHKHMHV